MRVWAYVGILVAVACVNWSGDASARGGGSRSSSHRGGSSHSSSSHSHSSTKSSSSHSSSSSSSSTHVHGYTTKNGTHVAPHERSKADGNFSNNWSTKGNVNPFTGKAGTKVDPSNRTSGGGHSSVPQTSGGPASVRDYGTFLCNAVCCPALFQCRPCLSQFFDRPDTSDPASV
jgi:hypothetical protein